MTDIPGVTFPNIPPGVIDQFSGIDANGGGPIRQASEGVAASMAGSDAFTSIFDALNALIDELQAGQGKGVVAYDLYATLAADLAHDAGTPGEVLKDSVGPITLRERTSNVAKLTVVAHGLIAGNKVMIRNPGGTGYASPLDTDSVPLPVTVIAPITANTFSYASVGSNEGSTAATGFVDRNGQYTKTGTAAPPTGAWTLSKDSGDTGQAIRILALEGISTGFTHLDIPSVDSYIDGEGVRLSFAPAVYGWFIADLTGYMIATVDEAKRALWLDRRPLIGADQDALLLEEDVLGGPGRARSITHFAEASKQADAWDGNAPYRTASTTMVAVNFPRAKAIVLTATSADIDVSYWFDGEKHLIIAEAAGTVYLGPAAASDILGGNTAHNELALSAGTAINLLRSGAYWIVQTVRGAAPTERARVGSIIGGRTIALAGQSHNVLAYRYGIGGYGTGLRDSTWLTPIVQRNFFVDGATGSSSIVETPVSVGNFWYNPAAPTTPGPAFATFLAQVDAALAAGQPLPAIIDWDQGENTAFIRFFLWETYENLVTYHTAFFARVQAEMVARGALADIPIIWSPLGSIDNFNQYGPAASETRILMHELIDAISYLHQGAEKYDIVRSKSGEAHFDESGYAIRNRRQARVIANILNAQTNNLGPAANNTAVLSADKRTAILTFTGTLDLDITPTLFGIVDADARPRTGGYVPVTRAYFDGSELHLETDGDLTGCRVLYPTGYGEDPYKSYTYLDNQIIRDTDGLPLRSFLTDPLA